MACSRRRETGFETMSMSVSDLTGFYGTPLGARTRQVLLRAVRRLWPSLPGNRLLGVGFPFPLMEQYSSQVERVFVFMFENPGVIYWPHSRPNATALVDPGMLPLDDCSVNRILLVHALEAVNDPGGLLAELWRILDPGGKMLLVTPNRRGIWARLDSTPFGFGQPFSAFQLRSLLRENNFSIERWIETLYMPPFRKDYLLRSAPVWENIGGGFLLPFAGVHVVEVGKQLYRPVLVRSPAPARRIPIFLPIPNPVGRAGI
jgi:SAM-dependent methyltransferase